MPPRPLSAQPTVWAVASLAARLERVRASLVELEGAADLTPYGAQRDSVRNLLHYLAFRRFDLRRDQARLAHWGLSSLGRSEGHVLYNLDAVLGWLNSLSGGVRRERADLTWAGPGAGPPPSRTERRGPPGPKASGPERTHYGHDAHRSGDELRARPGAG